MQTSRFLLAAQSGEFEMPDGRVAWLNASPYADLGTQNITAAQAHFPDHAALQMRGIDVSPVLESEVDHAVINAHRAKAATLELIGHAVMKTRPGGIIAVDGDKTDGIESILKELKRRFDEVASYSKAHGKLVWFTRPEMVPAIDDWLDSTYLFPNGWTTRAGVFSADGPDQGSKALAEVLPSLKGKIADLGAGWGYLTAEVLKSAEVSAIDGFEADYHAVSCARHNVTDPRASFHWTDVLQLDTDGYDTVVTNPPFHISRKPDPTLGAGFIRKAAEILKPKGQLWLVANRTLPYEATLEEHFRQTKTVAQTGGFKVIHAHTPKKARTR
ncbi:MAG: class I SAM-dependent methyltransferase [Pseudomonadota bacterium]